MKLSKQCVLCMSSVICFLIFAQNGLSQDRFIDCRKFANTISITIDGNGSDWPILSYGSSADFDAGLNLMTGDHFEINPETALYDNQGTSNAYNGTADMDAATYIAWDNNAFYVLNMARDSQIGFEHANSDTVDPVEGFFTGGSTGWTSDGIEFWFDNDNDRLPLNLDAQPDGNSVNDLQFNVIIDDALQRRDFPNLPEEDYGFTFNNFVFQYKEIFRWGDDRNDGGEMELALLETIDTATVLEADGQGYTQEIRIPFGSFPMFESANRIGFNISWLDWDNGSFSQFSWDGFTAGLPEFHQEMRFTSTNLLGGSSNIMDWQLYFDL